MTTHQPELPAPQGFLLLHYQGGVSQVHGYTAKQMQAYGDAREAAALSRPQDGVEPGRYFASGPEGCFFTDSMPFAESVVRKATDRDDWTITDLQNPVDIATPTAGQGGDDCTGCRGHGEIGGLTPTGYDSQQCPYCKGSGKETNPAPAAPVSERARELLAKVCDESGCPLWADALRNNEPQYGPRAFDIALRALEQALTQQRGESSQPGISYWAVQLPGKMPKLYGAYAFAEVNWYPDEGGALVRLQEVERIGEPTTPQPSAEGLRELCAVIVDNLRDLPVNTDWAKRTADRLESLLAGGG